MKDLKMNDTNALENECLQHKSENLELKKMLVETVQVKNAYS